METTQLVFNNQDGAVTAAGYLIDSAMLQQGQPAAIMSGGSLLDAMGLAVPLGLFYLQDLAKKSSESFNTSVFELYDEGDDESSNVKLVEDSLYEKLLAMVEGEEKVSKKAKMTRKRKASGGAKKTRGRKH
jgi:hypothetical protein